MVFGYQNEPDGFRDVKWGAPISSLDNFTETRRDDGNNVVFYSRSNDSMDVGGVAVNSIEYGFYEGRFLLASIRVSGHTQFTKLRMACTNMFGIGTLFNRSADLYVWGGSISTVRLRYDPEKDQGVLTMTSTEVRSMMKTNEKPMDPMEWKPTTSGF